MAIKPETDNVLRLIRDVLWIAAAGWYLWLLCVVCGILCYITVIFFPFGRQCFKIAHYAFCPYRREIVPQPSLQASGCVHLIWLVLAVNGLGISLMLIMAMLGALFCMTLVGIPFGLQCFDIIPLCLSPFDKDVVPVPTAPLTLPGGRSLS